MPSPKRKWSRVTSAERRQCETPGCEALAKERCKQFNCNQQHCEQHKGGHSAIHTLMQKRGIRAQSSSTGRSDGGRSKK